MHEKIKKIVVLAMIMSNYILSIGQTDSPCNSSNSVIATNLPVNNTCVITNGNSGGSSYSSNASNGGTPSCLAGNDPDVWFSFVAPVSGSVFVTFYSGTLTSGVMSIYSGTCGSFTELLCDDDGRAMPMNIVTNLTPGQTYFIRFWHRDGNRGTFGVCVTEPSTATPPACKPSTKAGETCATATPICDLNGYCGNTTDYKSGGLGSSGFCGTIENDSYLKVYATTTSLEFNIWVTSSTQNDGVQLMVFKPTNGCGSTIDNLYCKQIDYTTYATTVFVDGLTPGEIYYIMVDGYNGDDCDYIISVNVGIPEPVVITPETSSICVGETINLTATGGNGTYNWNASPHLNTTTGANVTVTPPNTPPTGTYTYTVNSFTDNPLCPNPAPATATINIIECGCSVIASNSGPVCIGESFNLSASDVANATYSWSGPNGFTSNLQNPSGLIALSGTYTVTVTMQNGNTCTASTTLNVYDLPTVSAGNNVNICYGKTTTITASGTISYIWDNGLGSGSSFVVTPTSTTIYTVTGTDANGCSNTATVQVIVNLLPTVDAGTDFSICQGQTATLSGNGAQTYTWDNGVTNSIIFTPSATTTFTVTGTDANGCSGTDQITVTVNPNIPVNAGADVAVCTGQSVTLTGSGTPTLSWDNGITDGVAFTPTSSGTYTVTGTSANGCITSDQVVVTINPLPTINAGNDQTVCFGELAVLQGNGGVNYVWNNGISNNASFIPSATTTYTVTGTDANGCTNTDQVQITVVPYPIAVLNADNSSGIAPHSVIFSNLSTNASAYTWSFGEGNPVVMNNNSNMNYTYNTPGTYTVYLTASNGSCSDIDSLQIIVLPIQPPTIEIPNVFTPNNDQINDEFIIRVTNMSELEVVILNRWGNVVYEYNDINGSWNGKVNGKEASQGVYFFKYRAIGLNGEEFKGHGNITLIRD